MFTVMCCCVCYVRSFNAPTQPNFRGITYASHSFSLQVAVQDRVCTQTGVLDKPALVLGKDVKEVPVWGIDCYTRRMVEMALEDRVPVDRRDEEKIRKFIERRLLPTINDQAPEKAHNMLNSINAIIEVG